MGYLFSPMPKCLLRRCLNNISGLQSQPFTLPENDLSNLTLDRIEHELQLMNENMAEANDIATLLAFPVMPADLDNDGRNALKRLREKIMERTKTRTEI